MTVDDSMLSLIQQRLGYTDEEMKEFRQDPRNDDILSRAPELTNKTVNYPPASWGASQGCSNMRSCKESTSWV